MYFLCHLLSKILYLYLWIILTSAFCNLTKKILLACYISLIFIRLEVSQLTIFPLPFHFSRQGMVNILKTCFVENALKEWRIGSDDRWRNYGSTIRPLLSMVHNWVGILRRSGRKRRHVSTAVSSGLYSTGPADAVSEWAGLKK